MSTTNPFDLLGDDDNDDPSLLLAAQQHKVAAAVTATKKTAPAAAAKPAKLPSKPLPPAEAVRESRNEGGRGGGRGGGGRGYGRGRGGSGGYRRDSDNGENTYGNDNGISYRPSEDGESGKPSERRSYSGPRGGYRGGRRGGFSNGEAEEGERPRRVYERRSGTGRGSDLKRDGSGRGNWGAPGEEFKQETEEPVGENEANFASEKKVNDEDNVDANKENPAIEAEEKEQEDKEMTLEEYEKVLEEKRKALLALKVEERKVDTKEFESMQMISKKKDEEEIFIKLGSDKDKRKEAADKEEKAKKSVSINEFLKPAEGESYYKPGGRGRGRGRGQRGGGGGGGFGGGRGYESRANDAPAPLIGDPGHFPSLK